MEREGRGENFVKRNRLNIVARSIAAISIAAAGAAAVEKAGSFDPLLNSVESANHLVLNNLHKSYDQLIDKLPEVEKAEAATINCNFPPLLNTYWCSSLPVEGDTVTATGEKSFVVDQIELNGCKVSGVAAANNERVQIIITSFGGTKGSPASSCPPRKSVGGIAELPEVSELPQNINSEKSKDYTIPIAAGVAAAAAAVAATGAVLYSRRNRST